MYLGGAWGDMGNLGDLGVGGVGQCGRLQVALMTLLGGACGGAGSGVVVSG